MPSAALVSCKAPRCAALVKAGDRYCEAHRKEGMKADDGYRPAAHLRGYDSRWSRYRSRYLRRHPLCSTCNRPANVVDHIRPVSGPEDPGFYDEENHQPLCTRCHAVKTAADKRDGTTR